MKLLGLIGGMSWESTSLYYAAINRRIREKAGGLHSAHLLMYSVDFAEIEILQRAGEWEKAGVVLAIAASSLEKIGAKGLVLCTNTMHIVASQIEAKIRIPLFHIADPTGEAIRKGGFKKVGLLGTRFTMEEEFYKERLERRFGLEVIVPEVEGRDTVHSIIYEELCNGVVREESRVSYVKVCERLIKRGVECIILGCTEIGMLLTEKDVPVPLFDTTMLHALYAADWMLDEGP